MVVVSLRSGDWLEPCLRSVRDQADQVVVVDNGSAGSEVSEVGRRLGATVVRNRENRGFAGGANQGIRQASGEVVALLNDDAVAGASWLASAEAALSDPSVGAVTPKVLLEGWYGQMVPNEETWYAPADARPLGRQLTSVRHDGVEVLDRVVGPGVHRVESGVIDGQASRWRWTRPGKPYFVPLPGPEAATSVTVNGTRGAGHCGLPTGQQRRAVPPADGYSGDRGLECPDDGRWDESRETFGVSGTAMVVRAETLDRVGLFAEPYFAYYEDTDWSWRARRQGLRMVYLPDAEVSHRRSVTSVQTLGDKVRILGERNRLLCLVRNAPSDVMARETWRRVADGPDHGIRRGMLARLPWRWPPEPASPAGPR